jgi:hypothetical protein
MKIYKIKKITKLNKEKVYDIIDVNKNQNYIGNSLILHNSSEDWAKRENKDLKKRLAQIRTKHLLFILCFPLKVQKLEKNYLESFCNYWVDLFGRGAGAIYVKDRNPVHDSWRLKEFTKLGSYTEFTNINQVEQVLKKHPNFWKTIKFPKPPEWLYKNYMHVREANVYDEDAVFKNVSKEDIHRALLILALRDIMTHDVSLTMNRIILHIKNEYDLSVSKGMVENAIDDAKMLIQKIRNEGADITNFSNEREDGLRPDTTQSL